jgi:2-aminoadipate transaminase
VSTAWKSRFALRTKNIKSSTIRELLKITQHPEVISFAGGLPAPDVFPVTRFQEACRKVLEVNGHQALQYGASEGYEPLPYCALRH